LWPLDRMGAIASKRRSASGEAQRLRNGAGDKIWANANSEESVASIARLEAQANVEAQNNPEVERDRDDAEFAEHGCRLAYSSYLAVSNREEAKQLLAAIFTTALLRNPAKAIGGMLFYDEATSCIVQVLEGPAQVTRELFSKIEVDPRHTSVKKLWDIDVETRRFDGFGMKLGASASDAKTALDASPGHNTGREELLKLTYMSQLAAATRDIAYEHIESILAVAIVTNPKLHIGGALFLNPRTLHVVQVLEGPQRAVRALYEKIATDTRHNQCVVLSDELVHARTYDQWGMLQGNLADWSALAAGGWATGSSGRTSTPRASPTHARCTRGGRRARARRSRSTSGSRIGRST